MRKFTKKRELVRPGVTRFATAYLSLQRMYKRRMALRSMFASEEWSRYKWSRDSKGKKARDIVLSKYFWRGMKHAILVFLPLVKVLRLVDAYKPSMGFIYDAMERANNYALIWEIIDDKWDRQLHRPFHAAGYYLNLKFFYADADIESKGVIMDGFNECLENLVSDPHIQDKISIEELILYKCSLMSFGKDMALRQRNKDGPAHWWRHHRSSAPNLQKMAIRILSLITTSSGCERNWSLFEMVYTKRRNRLEQKKLNDLVFVRENQRLKEKKNQPKKDAISSKDMENASDWLVSDPSTEEASGQASDPRRTTRATSFAGTSRREIEEEEADLEESLEEEDDDSDDDLNSNADENNEDDDFDSY
ncbi:hypothetical protein AMTRI_Chr02g215320 [Amborella trichopoda]